MSLSALLTKPATITRVTAGAGRDAYNNPTTSTATSSTVCYFEQKLASEDTVARTTEDEEWIFVFPEGTALDATDRITVDGATYEVDGPPWPVWNPRLGVGSQVECRARRVA